MYILKLENYFMNTGNPCIVPSTVPEKYRYNAKQYYARSTL